MKNKTPALVAPSEEPAEIRLALIAPTAEQRAWHERKIAECRRLLGDRWICSKPVPRVLPEKVAA